VIALVIVAVGLLVLMPARSSWRLRPPRRLIPQLQRRVRSGSQPAAVVEMLAAMRDELRAGASLRPAFEASVQAGGDPLLCRDTLAVCRMGGDVPASLRDEAHNHPLMLSLAALWQVSEGSGAALADALDRLVLAAEQSSKLRREVAAQLAGPRGTVRVLAVLPIVGVGMGLLMGADPVGFLIGSPWGLACLTAAILLEAAGVLWMRRLVSGIERQL
jgi:tight adherence protein B